MKRGLGLFIVIAAIVTVSLCVRGAMPFMAVLGDSMEPEYKAGDLITIEKASYSEINMGDVVVINIPPLVREAYNYPVAIAHRVVRIVETESGTTFRTKGDNTGGEDPFVVRSQDIKGKVGNRIPFLGFPLLYLQSTQGLVFIIISLCLFTVYLYAEELNLARKKVLNGLLGGLLAPLSEETRRSSRLLEEKIESTQKGMESTEQTLSKFASAIEEYAKHLESHTSAIQGLSEASQELKKSTAEHNQVLARLTEATEQVAQKKDREALETKRLQPVEQSENGSHDESDIRVPSSTSRSIDQDSSEPEQRQNDERRDMTTPASSGTKIQLNRPSLIARLDAFIEALTPREEDSGEIDQHEVDHDEERVISGQGSE